LPRNREPPDVGRSSGEAEAHNKMAKAAGGRLSACGLRRSGRESRRRIPKVKGFRPAQSWSQDFTSVYMD